MRAHVFLRRWRADDHPVAPRATLRPVIDPEKLAIGFAEKVRFYRGIHYHPLLITASPRSKRRSMAAARVTAPELLKYRVLVRFVCTPTLLAVPFSSTPLQIRNRVLRW
jgi:hypothetical protein